MAFEYTDIEDAIVTKLAEIVPAESYSIIALPESQAQYEIPEEGVLITVAYADSQFSPSDSVSIITQNETVTMLCNVKAMNLRGSAGINEALRVLKIVLVGYQPPNLSKLQLQKIEFDDRNVDDNYFSYNVFFTGKKKNVEITTDETGPLLKELFYRDK